MTARREVVVGLGAYAAYLGVRQLVWNERGRTRAAHNARRVAAWERRVGVLVEPRVQAAAARAHRLMTVLNAGYAAGNVMLSVGWLVMLYRRGDPTFARERRAALAAFASALPMHAAFPMAPPRALDGFVDTLRAQGIDLEHPALVRFYNPISAMPSYHMAFAVVSGLGLAQHAHSHAARLALAGVSRARRRRGNRDRQPLRRRRRRRIFLGRAGPVEHAMSRREAQRGPSSAGHEPSAQPADPIDDVAETEADIVDDAGNAAEEMESRRLRVNAKEVLAGIALALVVLTLIVVFIGRLAGFSHLASTLRGADEVWLAVCAGGQIVVFVGYAGAFRATAHFEDGPRISTRLALRVVLASFAMSQVVAAGGAAGIAVTYWAMRRLGRSRRDSGVRVIGLNTVVYLVFVMIGLLAAVLTLRAGDAAIGRHAAVDRRRAPGGRARRVVHRPEPRGRLGDTVRRLPAPRPLRRRRGSLVGAPGCDGEGQPPDARLDRALLGRRHRQPLGRAARVRRRPAARRARAGVLHRLPRPGRADPVHRHRRAWTPPRCSRCKGSAFRSRSRSSR